jgi:hypothetical protein
LRGGCLRDEERWLERAILVASVSEVIGEPT